MDDRTPQSAAACPVCKAAVKEGGSSFPFCSARCRKIDLGRWMDERYVVSRPIEQTDLDALE
ncbi:MAG: DNA gyrase inhibitor YacG [Planctomycetota bacterium]